MIRMLALGFSLTVMANYPAYAGSCGGADHVHTPQEVASKYFDKMDVNKDGIVTKAEFDGSPVAKMVTSYEFLQPNKEGLVEKNSFIKAFVKAHSSKGEEA